MVETLVPGRSCGPCNVCCIAPTIDEPTLQKLPGYRCHNALPSGGCAIYETRPRTCQNFYCGWRRLKWVREEMRPDISGVLVRLDREASLVQGHAPYAVSFGLLRKDSVKATGLAESVAASVHAQIATSIFVPGPPGHGYSRLHVNEELADAVSRRDKPAILRRLAELRAEARAAEHKPVILACHE